jgi:hypothetical protein
MKVTYLINFACLKKAPLVLSQRMNALVYVLTKVVDAQVSFIQESQHFQHQLEEMNRTLTGACEQLKQLTVTLFLLNNDTLFMNSNVLLHQLERVKKEGLIQHQREE